MKKYQVIIQVLCVGLLGATAACSKKETPPLEVVKPKPVEPAGPATGGTLLFQSGFEKGGASNTNFPRIVQSTAQFDKLFGMTEGMEKSDWDVNTGPNSIYFGKCFINYEQGDYSKRRAEIVPDPANATNNVLRTRIVEKHIFMPSGEVKARIQMELRNEGTPPQGGFLKEYYQTCRIYFSPNFSVLENAGTNDIGWFIMQEFWNDPSWTYPGQKTPRQARTEVLVVRRNGKLRFAAKGQDPITEVPAPGNNSWEVINTNFAIPLGKWMTQEIYVKEGGSAGTANPGRFYLAVTPDGGTKTVLVDKIGMTTSEEPGYIPDGQTSWNPIKVYTEGKVLDWFKNQGKTMDIYWDDLQIWKDRKPGS